MNTTRKPSAPEFPSLRSGRRDPASFVFTGLTGLATLFILLILFVIIANIAWHGWGTFSWRFLTGSADQDMFDVNKAGVLPMIIGTSLRVMLMTVFVVPIGVTTAVYLTEYAQANSWTTRVISGAVNNLAGVPSIVFGLFGLGFFINFLGGALDAGSPTPHWGKPAILWASLTLSVMTLPLVIVATEESLRSITPGLREASLALGATKLQTIVRIVLPQAMPGILTGGILAVGRAGGEVAPILFTGAAYYMRDLPKAPTDQFMDLGYHVFVLSTQSPDIERTRPILFATALTLLLLTLSMNLVTVIVRARMRARMRAAH